MDCTRDRRCLISYLEIPILATEASSKSIGIQKLEQKPHSLTNLPPRRRVTVCPLRRHQVPDARSCRPQLPASLGCAPRLAWSQITATRFGGQSSLAAEPLLERQANSEGLACELGRGGLLLWADFNAAHISLNVGFERVS
jgi:hypothetical protein